ncbi:unnamed protein product [Citrullus colocynthis]|uniref:Uncharacterized protein n=1 Tax=Citrullus colocynthis TaxID=252529 RepID=A0ABP0XU02_9ROSI
MDNFHVIPFKCCGTPRCYIYPFSISIFIYILIGFNQNSLKMSSDEIEARKILGVQLGHCLAYILPQSDVAIKYPSFVPLFDQLLDGIPLNNGAQKFYLNKETNSNRVFIPVKSLTIYGIDDPRYWKLSWLEEWGKKVNIAEVVGISRFDVRGLVKAALLTPKVIYIVVFVVLLHIDAKGWTSPVNLIVKKPDGSKIESKISLEGKPRGEYFEVIVGELTLDDRGCADTSVIEFGMYEHGSQPKSGLVLKGGLFRSKASAGCPHADTK